MAASPRGRSVGAGNSLCLALNPQRFIRSSSANRPIPRRESVCKGAQEWPSDALGALDEHACCLPNGNSIGWHPHPRHGSIESALALYKVASNDNRPHRSSTSAASKAGIGPPKLLPEFLSLDKWTLVRAPAIDTANDTHALSAGRDIIGVIGVHVPCVPNVVESLQATPVGFVEDDAELLVLYRFCNPETEEFSTYRRCLLLMLVSQPPLEGTDHQPDGRQRQPCR